MSIVQNLYNYKKHVSWIKSLKFWILYSYVTIQKKIF